LHLRTNVKCVGGMSAWDNPSIWQCWDQRCCEPILVFCQSQAAISINEEWKCIHTKPILVFSECPAMWALCPRKMKIHWVWTNFGFPLMPSYKLHQRSMEICSYQTNFGFWFMPSHKSHKSPPLTKNEKSIDCEPILVFRQWQAASSICKEWKSIHTKPLLVSVDANPCEPPIIEKLKSIDCEAILVFWHQAASSIDEDWKSIHTKPILVFSQCPSMWALHWRKMKIHWLW